MASSLVVIKLPLVSSKNCTKPIMERFASSRFVVFWKNPNGGLTVNGGSHLGTLLALTFSCLSPKMDFAPLVLLQVLYCAAFLAVWPPPFVIWLIFHTHICFVLSQDQQGTPSPGMMELLLELEEQQFRFENPLNC